MYWNWDRDSNRDVCLAFGVLELDGLGGSDLGLEFLLPSPREPCMAQAGENITTCSIIETEHVQCNGGDHEQSKGNYGHTMGWYLHALGTG